MKLLAWITESTQRESFLFYICKLPPDVVIHIKGGSDSLLMCIDPCCCFQGRVYLCSPGSHSVELAVLKLGKLDSLCLMSFVVKHVHCHKAAKGGSHHLSITGFCSVSLALLALILQVLLEAHGVLPASAGIGALRLVCLIKCWIFVKQQWHQCTTHHYFTT